MQDYSEIERSLSVCTACESLVPVEEMSHNDGTSHCYGCSMIAAGAVELELDLEVC